MVTDEAFRPLEINTMGKSYTVTQKNIVKFQERVIQIMEQNS